MKKIEVSISREGPADVVKILCFMAVATKPRQYLLTKREPRRAMHARSHRHLALTEARRDAPPSPSDRQASAPWLRIELLDKSVFRLWNDTGAKRKCSSIHFWNVLQLASRSQRIANGSMYQRHAHGVMHCFGRDVC